MGELLREFFAVTVSGSLYRIIYSSGETTVEKIAIRNGAKSKVPVGDRLKIGTFDHTGSNDYVGIASYGIFLYYGFHRADQKRPLPEFVNTSYWGGKTSAVVGLFIRENDARACINAENLQMLDLRWASQTEEVYIAIGASHPKFVLSVMDSVVR